MTIRNIEVGFPDTTKSYVSIENCRTAINKIRLEGSCNVRIVPVVKTAELVGPSERSMMQVHSVRYTAYFYCFENLSDAARIAHAGFCVHN